MGVRLVDAEQLMKLLDRFVIAVERIAANQCKHEELERQWGTFAKMDRLDLRLVCYGCNTSHQAPAEDIERELLRAKQWKIERDKENDARRKRDS
jgi:hypothetical protein